MTIQNIDPNTGQPIEPVSLGIASDSFTTHNAIPVVANSTATAVEVATTGFRKAIVIVNGNGVQNCQALVYGVMRDGSTPILMTSTTAGLSGVINFDLNGLDSIQINVKNTDATTANTITSDVFLQQ